MKNIINEAITKRKNISIDPYGEENWDEYEIKINDIFYFFGINNNLVFSGIAKSVAKDDYFRFKIIKSDLNSVVNSIIDNVNINNLTLNQIDYPHSYLSNAVILCIVTDFKLDFYYNNISEKLRMELYNNIININNGIQASDKKMNIINDNILKLKKQIKIKEQFPSVNDFELKNDEYVVIQYFKNNRNIEFYITKIKKEIDKDNKETYNLIDIETNEKLIFLLENYLKLKEKGYLLLKSKKDTNKETYVTNNLEHYPVFVDNIIMANNDDLIKNINNLKKDFEKLVSEQSKYTNLLKEIRTYYLKFNFTNIVKDLKSIT